MLQQFKTRLKGTIKRYAKGCLARKTYQLNWHHGPLARPGRAGFTQKGFLDDEHGTWPLLEGPASAPKAGPAAAVPAPVAASLRGLPPVGIWTFKTEPSLVCPAPSSGVPSGLIILKSPMDTSSPKLAMIQLDPRGQVFRVWLASSLRYPGPFTRTNILQHPKDRSHDLCFEIWKRYLCAGKRGSKATQQEARAAEGK